MKIDDCPLKVVSHGTLLGRNVDIKEYMQFDSLINVTKSMEQHSNMNWIRLGQGENRSIVSDEPSQAIRVHAQS